jgi:hypothetical protein
MPWRHVIAIALVAGTAEASHNYSAETEDEKRDDVSIVEVDREPQFEGSVGFEVGTFHTGPVYNLAYGLALDGGVRIDRLALLGNYALLGLSDTAAEYAASQNTVEIVGGDGSPSYGPSTGLVQRFGLAARYSVAKGGTADHGTGIRFDTWVEAGLGEQMLRWSGGGYLHRPDIEIAVGLQLNMRGTRHHGGFFMGVRATLANAPRMVGPPPPPTCAGPCDGPTGPIGIDRSILFVMAVDFGG